jgi:hypothetical protein
MDLQNTFYVLGIIFMTLSILILLGIAILLFYIRKKITDLHDLVELKITEFTELTLDPLKKASNLARSLFPHKTKA